MVVTLIIKNTLCNLLPGDTSRGQTHHHHHGHHIPGEHNQLLNIHVEEVEDIRKGKSDEGLIDFSNAVLDSVSGLNCVMVEGNTSSKEHTKTCYHSTVPVCYDSYETLFRPGSREELCTEYYKKECRIVERSSVLSIIRRSVG